MLIEAQRLIDELQIMQEVFTQQLAVTRDLEKAIQGNAKCQGPVRERADEVVQDINMRREELAGLEKLATKIRLQASAPGCNRGHSPSASPGRLTLVQIRELLDMKQQQAGIIEAKAAIKRADVSVLQGHSIIVFTVFTIFVSDAREECACRRGAGTWGLKALQLPLSFFASVFGMNAAELNGGLMPLAKQLKYMCTPSPVEPPTSVPNTDAREMKSPYPTPSYYFLCPSPSAPGSEPSSPSPPGSSCRT